MKDDVAVGTAALGAAIAVTMTACGVTAIRGPRRDPSASLPADGSATGVENVAWTSYFAGWMRLAIVSRWNAECCRTSAQPPGASGAADAAARSLAKSCQEL